MRYRAEVTARELVEAVYAVGGEPLVVHPHAPGSRIDEDDVDLRLDAIADGVLLPGGGDLAAAWTGQDHHPTLYDLDEEQDAFDLAVARVCLRRGIPLLAICRGMQVVNAAQGGKVVQDMAETYGANHRNVVDDVAVSAGSTLAGMVGECLAASCYHHQCIDELGDGLEAVAHSPTGLIEAIEHPQSPGWFLGLQWHPEDTWRHDDAQRDIFRGLVAASR